MGEDVELAVNNLINIIYEYPKLGRESVIAHLILEASNKYDINKIIENITTRNQTPIITKIRDNFILVSKLKKENE